MVAKRAVIDTNVLVAGGINPDGKPAQVLAAVERLALQPVLSAAVLAEYRDVLSRRRFAFRQEWIKRLLENLGALGIVLEPPPIATDSLPDAGDAPFIALALLAGCPVITGNAKHFPADAGVQVLTPAEWLAQDDVG